MTPPIRARPLSRCCNRARSRQYAALAQASTQPQSQIYAVPPISRYPPTQPPSHKPPELRKSQLLRQYTSLLQSSPLILFFQHNNLLSTEWNALRREFSQAILKADSALDQTRSGSGLAHSIKIQALQTSIFTAAMRLVEFHYPSIPSQGLLDPATPRDLASQQEEHTHALSTEANSRVRRKKLRGGLQQLLAGPIAVVAFPTIEPALLKATFQILAPNAPDFPPPTRRASPGYHDPKVQSAVQKLMLLGARAEGRVYDGEQIRRIGTLQGLEGTRAELAGTLQGVAGRLVATLDGPGRSLWATLESRRMAMEEEGKPEENKA